MAGTHEFAVTDADAARRLARDLAEYGFPQVTAWPWGEGGGWRVIAFDEGPYPPDLAGRRAIGAVARAAALIAQPHGGYRIGATRVEAGTLKAEEQSYAPLLFRRPGARPAMPEVVVADPPPGAELPLVPDAYGDVPVDVAGVDDIAWEELEHAQGSAADIPGLIHALADPRHEGWDEVLATLFGDKLLHQGDCDTATAPALPFLTRIIVSGAMPARRRLDLYLWLLIAADRLADGLRADAERAAAQGGEPWPAFQSPEVHRIVGEQLPALLDRWETEPPAIRFVIAVLAAIYPEQGAAIGERITEMAQEFQGTQPGEFLRLADALVHGRTTDALAIATDILTWAERLDPDWLEAQGLPITLRLNHFLTEAASEVIAAIE